MLIKRTVEGEILAFFKNTVMEYLQLYIISGKTFKILKIDEKNSIPIFFLNYVSKLNEIILYYMKSK